MKIQIRSGLFETNSSSAHTLVYSKNEHVNPDEYTGATLSADLQSYGRYYELLDTPGKKLSYILTLLNWNTKFYNKYIDVIKSTLAKAKINYTSNDVENLKEEVAKGIFNPNHILSHAEWYCSEILGKPFDDKYYDDLFEKRFREFKKKYPNPTREIKKKYWPSRIYVEDYLINNFQGTPAQKQQLIDTKKTYDWEKYRYFQIDHQSMENYIKYPEHELIPELDHILTDEKALLDFLFSPKSFIIIDYDENSTWWKDFKEAFDSHGIPYPKELSKELLDLKVEEEIWYNEHNWDEDFPKEDLLEKVEANGYYFPDGVHVIE